MKYCFGNISSLPVSQVQIAGYAYQINYLAYMIEKMQKDIENLDPESQGEAITTLQANVEALQEALEALQESVGDKSSVTPNPASTGSETALERVTIDGTAYRLGNVQADVISMTGYLSDIGDTVTLGKSILNYDFVTITFGYRDGVDRYHIASAGFSPEANAYPQDVVLSASVASTITALAVSIVSGTSVACAANTAGYTWLPIKCIGYKII